MDITQAPGNAVACGGGTAVYQNDVLTLTDAEITGVWSSAGINGAQLKQPLEIVLVGANSISNAVDDGILCGPSLTISGNGTLTIENNHEYARGIHVLQGAANIGANLILRNAANGKGWAIDLQGKAKSTIDGAKISVSGYQTAINLPFAPLDIVDSAIEIQKCTLGINGGDGAISFKNGRFAFSQAVGDDARLGISCYSDLTIDNCTIEAASANSNAIYCEGKVRVEGASKLALRGYYPALWAAGSIAISGTSVVEARSANSSAIYSKNGNIAVSGGSLKVNDDIKGQLVVSGGEVTVTGDLIGSVNATGGATKIAYDVVGNVTGDTGLTVGGGITGTVPQNTSTTYYTATLAASPLGGYRLTHADVDVKSAVHAMAGAKLALTFQPRAVQWLVDGAAAGVGARLERVMNGDCVIAVREAPAPKVTIQFYALVGPEEWAVVKTENVNPGEDAEPPAEEDLYAPEGMKFAGWDGEYENVQYDRTITARYEPVKSEYTVQFVDHDGSVLKEERVEAGKDATPPADPAREGYSFTGWEGSYKNVQGDVTIKARYEKLPEPTKKALRICVEDQPYEVLELAIPKAVTVAAYDENGKQVEVVWSCDSKKVTTKKKSESRYKVKAAKAGEATVIATAADGRYGELKVEVKKTTQAVTSGQLNKKEKELKVGEEYQLKATLKPKSAKNKELYWLSTNEGIATVDQSGKVTAVGPGRVAIKAWTATGIKLKCMVTVK